MSLIVHSNKPESYRYSEYKDRNRGKNELALMRSYVDMIGKKLIAGIEYDEATMKDYNRYKNVIKNQ